ncbi:NDP-sugar synthase [Myxococcota bacterium]|nr:NDP-sugar synthase [Myxococcota bacterium]MCZ7618847.1 NDP-sugar synthase [Myxococcota bacterium]
MRAMILAAGLGARMQPLSALRPKPVLPVVGIPLVAWPLAWLARHGVREVVLNLHHLPHATRAAAEAWTPPGLAVRFSEEPDLLDTGGGIRRAAPFLRESDPSIVISGDMICDFDLSALVARHRARGDRLTLALRDDPRGDRFGTIGLDSEGRMRRIARRFDLGGEIEAGVNVSVYVFARRAFDSLPARRVFNHLDDWVAPELASGAQDLRGERFSGETLLWEPVGTPSEYLAVNLELPTVSYFDAPCRARALGVRIEPGLVIGAGAKLEPGVRLRRAVVWNDELVPEGLHAEGGVFAGGRFHRCESEGERTTPRRVRNAP